MVAMHSVVVAVVHVVDVVTVGHRNMATAITVGVAMTVVGGVLGRLTLVDVALVRTVQVALVGVVNVVTVRDRDVPATLAVDMVVAGVFYMCGGHGLLTSWRSRSVSAVRSNWQRSAARCRMPRQHISSCA
jgi:hypothetical protein